MKRIQLFEFEDFSWFPNSLRMCMTRYINMMHRLLDSKTDLKDLLLKGLEHSKEKHIYDLCSGAGGPMPDVLKEIQKEEGYKNTKLSLSDLYPNTKVIKEIKEQKNPSLEYLETPVDATNVEDNKIGLRTMICSMHHMPVTVAKSILKDAKDDRQPICIFEISDNSVPPKALWWIAIPTTFIMVFLLTPLIRPMSWQQLVFTYIIPVLPIFIAWDGAVSNIRTYTLNDWDEVLADLQSDDYVWEKGIIKNKVKKMYLMGYPV
jgi:hypothetical protein